MEVIVITDNPEYSQLIPGAKIMRTSAIDIFSIIETQIFLNHHHNISLYFIRDNLPIQYQLPLKVASQLLDRQQCQEIQFTINQTEQMTLSVESDLMQIFSKIQIDHNLQQHSQAQLNSLQSSQYRSTYYESTASTLHYCFKYWQIKISLIFTNMMNILNAYRNGQVQTSKKEINLDLIGNEELGKIIFRINDQNYRRFLIWSDNIEINKIYLHENHQLSKQYLTLKQEIQNQKNAFRKKIKIVEAILGENICVEKLLCEEDGKDQSSEFKRLKETFQTIKNIDNVLIQQESQIKLKSEELKLKRKIRSSAQYKNAQIVAKLMKEQVDLKKDIENLKFQLASVFDKKMEFLENRSFDINKEIRQQLEKEINKIKGILKSSHNNKSLTKQETTKNGKYLRKQNNHTSMYSPQPIDNNKSTIILQKKTKYIQQSTLRNQKTRYFQNIKKRAIPISFYEKTSSNPSEISANQKIAKRKCNKENERNQRVVQIENLLVSLKIYSDTVSELQLKINQSNKIVKKQSNLIDYKEFPMLQKLLNRENESEAPEERKRDQENKNLNMLGSKMMPLDGISEKSTHIQKPFHTFKIRKHIKKPSISKLEEQ